DGRDPARRRPQAVEVDAVLAVQYPAKQRARRRASPTACGYMDAGLRQRKQFFIPRVNAHGRVLRLGRGNSEGATRATERPSEGAFRSSSQSAGYAPGGRLKGAGGLPRWATASSRSSQRRYPSPLEYTRRSARLASRILRRVSTLSLPRR